MPILTAPDSTPPPAGQVLAVIPAAPGLHATAPGALAGPVVAWAQVADPATPGGARVDPVVLASGRTWTPDQIRAAYGDHATVTVA